MQFLKSLHVSHIAFVILLALGAMFPAQAEAFFVAFSHHVTRIFGEAILLAILGFLALCLYLAFSKYGKLRLGGPDEKPQFGFLSWSAMLFAAGMGSGLVFNGVAEPLTHFMAPPPSAEGILDPLEQARRAMSITFFHWGLHAGAIYTIGALTVAYFAFHQHAPMLPSTPIQGVATRRGWGVLRDVTNMLAIVAVVFGLVATLAKGVTQLADGLVRYFTLEESGIVMQIAVLIAMFVAYMLSASTGLQRGIKWLSNINMLIAIALLLFVVVVGPTLFIAESFWYGIIDYFTNFFADSFGQNLSAETNDWGEFWTITYMLWWVAWAPFVGVFIARISRGRTIRQFVCTVICIPVLFSLLWFSAFGGTALHLEMVAQPGFGAIYTDMEAATYAMFAGLPLTEVTQLALLALLFVFLVTSADSGTFVLGMFSSNGSLEPAVGQRLFWGAAIAILSAAVLYLKSGFAFLHAFAVFGGASYLVIMLWQCIGLWKALGKDMGAESN